MTLSGRAQVSDAGALLGYAQPDKIKLCSWDKGKLLEEGDCPPTAVKDGSMTLIHAAWWDNGFDVYADTLVSGGKTESGGKKRFSSCYTKLLVLPVKYRTRSNKQPRSFELGMAVTGGLVVCNAIYGLLSSLLQDLRAEGVDGVKRPPLFDEIVELAVKVARIVFDDAPDELTSCFGFVLLGIEQSTGRPRWTLIETKMIDGMYEVVSKDYPEVFQGARISEGSAGPAHMAHLRANQADKSPISMRFYRYVMSGERSDIGGGYYLYES